MNENRQNESTKPSDKVVEIYVNGTEKLVPKGLITYESVVILAFGNYDNSQKIVYTVTYHKGNVEKPKGTLVEGQSVRVTKGMIFNVTRTDQS